MLTVRPATDTDIAMIGELAEKIWRVHYTPMIGVKQVEYMLEKMYSPASLLQQMKEGAYFFIAENNGKPIGYVSISDKGRGDFFLNKFYLDVSEQGKGFGKTIFADIISRFPQLKTIRLQVNRRNFKSVNFYFRLGFTIEYVKDFDIGEGYSMDDFVMLFRK
jgi:RimJ/RimL family protein N-acetyltransferase